MSLQCNEQGILSLLFLLKKNQEDNEWFAQDPVHFSWVLGEESQSAFGFSFAQFNFLL